MISWPPRAHPDTRAPPTQPHAQPSEVRRPSPYGSCADPGSAPGRPLPPTQPPATTDSESRYLPPGAGQSPPHCNQLDQIAPGELRQREPVPGPTSRALPGSISVVRSVESPLYAPARHEAGPPPDHKSPERASATTHRRDEGTDRHRGTSRRGEAAQALQPQPNTAARGRQPGRASTGRSSSKTAPPTTAPPEETAGPR